MVGIDYDYWTGGMKTDEPAGPAAKYGHMDEACTIIEGRQFT
jgi:hypothetical protein